MLDSSVVGRLAHPRPNRTDTARLDYLLASRVPVFLPELADYEVRRSLLLHRLLRSLQKLDALHDELIYAPITTAVMLRAAELWAEARRRGRPTADTKSLDADVILAAQARESGAVVATENVQHLSRYVRAVPWSGVRAP